ncbi:BMP family ABC transporter substrate-binding protein [Pseudaminobacter sp. 19-2017]|uniref:BMP family ABC transporter substrate-binding protein n=1 Tax=Pseudaminobacter soli (ex Zhang et al. 2022) TaxID=2831468 RepID=A0A942E6E8_9HYPH|nr:BMP family ABC transporter substrate-binding protein [Pseudaminobacter soli]MBS3652120.1 BMP family ABC transporter substrate-binding protein [Pseudaminobacter soli]
MRNKILKWALAACAALSVGVAQAEPVTIGFIYPAPVADVGWAKQLDLGREAVEKKLGDKVKTRAVENIPEGPDAARVMNQLVTDGAKFVVLGSFGYMNDGLRLARQKPDVAFLHASGFKQSANFGTFTARNYEGFYLGGLAAAMVTKTNTIGIVGAFAIPEVVAEVNAIALAARKVNPDLKIKIVWLNTWFDPPKEQEAARALISQGADVLFSLHQDTPSVVNVAQAQGVYVVNTNSDMSAHGPDAVLASVTDDWSGYFVKNVEDMLNGSFNGTDFRGGLADGTVKVVAWNKALTEEQMAQIKQAEADLMSGKTHVFAGPLRDQQGTVRVEEGANLPDPEIFAMNWLVEGLDGTLPK